MQTDDNSSTIKLPLKKRLAELTVGFISAYCLSLSFDYLLYPFVIYRLGILNGGLLMTFLSFNVCIGLMKFYDWSKRDWLGIETIKNLKGYAGTTKLGRFVAWILKKGDSAAFLFLSIKHNPFVTTAYLRQGKFSGMNKRDWVIFILSSLVSNAYWTFACFMGISLIEWLWKYLIIGTG